MKSNIYQKNDNKLEIDWDLQFNFLQDWVVKEKKYNVYKTYKKYKKSPESSWTDSWVDFDKKEIVISMSKNPEISFYYLLHEVGHILVTNNKRKYNEFYNKIRDTFSRQSKTVKILVLQEELDAWEKGLKLAKTLKLPIRRKKYEIVKTQCISTYLNWCIR